MEKPEGSASRKSDTILGGFAGRKSDTIQRQIPARPVLGKGLASLLPAYSESDSNKDRHPGISFCSVEEVFPNGFQPRKNFNETSLQELAESIQANGLIQPLVVRKTIQGYELIAGERRLRAAKLAGLKQVPIVIRKSTDKEALELALIENIQRENLNCIDTALAYYQLIHDFDLTQEMLSKRVGKDRTTVTNHLRLLKLPAFIQTALKNGDLSYGHGKALAGIENTKALELLSKEVIEKKLSVRELEARVQKSKELEPVRDAHATQHKEESSSTKHNLFFPTKTRFQAIEKELSYKYGTKAFVKGNEIRGKFIIEYYNSEDRERVITLLLK